MAKALIGYMSSDLRTPAHLTAAKLDLEAGSMPQLSEAMQPA